MDKLSIIASIQIIIDTLSEIKDREVKDKIIFHLQNILDQLAKEINKK